MTLYHEVMTHIVRIWTRYRNIEKSSRNENLLKDNEQLVRLVMCSYFASFLCDFFKKKNFEDSKWESREGLFPIKSAKPLKIGQRLQTLKLSCMYFQWGNTAFGSNKSWQNLLGIIRKNFDDMYDKKLPVTEWQSLQLSWTAKIIFYNFTS